MKFVIIGNSGSGKTWLANQLAPYYGATIIHLDELFWMPGGFDRVRRQEEVLSLVQQSKKGTAWIVEGVFGELAEEYLAEAEALVWLDLEWALCRSRLEQRGSESKAHMSRTQSTDGLVRLIEWASQYYSRIDSRSREGHSRLVQAFTGTRFHLQTETAILEFVWQHCQKTIS